jgi:hypothetical protein
MINFPIFEKLEICGYGLFPGTAEAPGLDVQFLPGLTLVIGANGLGKTTLISILFRLLTGPYDIPGLAGRRELGALRLTPALLPSTLRCMFSHRVADGAKEAKARATISIGDTIVIIERSLKDLSLTSLIVNGEEVSIGEESSFQPTISKLVGVWSFGDWILLLRQLVFYFEDRRALVWDTSAQRQVFRFLFLTPETAQKWTEDEREILELDSRMRNLNAAVTREERALSSNEYKLGTANEVREELKTLAGLQSVDIEKRDLFEGDILGLENHRQQSRLKLLKLEQDREGAYRELERAKLVAIEARFPKESETARYIIGHLVTDGECLVCGKDATEAAMELQARLDGNRCVVCANLLGNEEKVIIASEVADHRVEKLHDLLRRLDAAVSEARRELEEMEKAYSTQVVGISTLNNRISERSYRMDALIRTLPPEEAKIHQQRADLSGMRGKVLELKQELAQKRIVFTEFVQRVSRDIVKSSEGIKNAFGEYARGFLLESCELLWSPQKDRVGETGDLIDFPAFELEMTGSDFPTLVPRVSPDQVSESQREFIDLAFRMALMAIAGGDRRGTLVVDAPESSLDAVFVVRAADVMSTFALPSRDNRLIITSNLVEGQLIPQLLGKCVPPEEKRDRIVDLFEIATPTAAVRKYKDEYIETRYRLLGI